MPELEVVERRCRVSNTTPLVPRNLQLNVVGPAPVVEPGQERRGLITADQAAEANVNAVEGDFTGRVLRAWGGLPFFTTVRTENPGS